MYVFNGSNIKKKFQMFIFCNESVQFCSILEQTARVRLHNNDDSHPVVSYQYSGVSYFRQECNFAN